MGGVGSIGAVYEGYKASVGSGDLRLESWETQGKRLKNRLGVLLA